MSTAEAKLAELCGAQIVAREPLAGGDISGASRIALVDGRTVIAKRGPVVAREARMLAAIRTLGAPAPAVIGQADDWLVLEDVGPSRPFDARAWEEIPQALEPLRSADQDETYGWPEDYALRDVTVSNTRTTDWAAFWRDNRLVCHCPDLALPLARRVEALTVKLADIIPASPPAALVHGDLWGGNVVWNGERASLIDPCAYYGDREVDVAAMTVFDTPPEAFFDRLELSPGWRARLPVYRLWMWLTHVRLFGESYRPAAEADLDSLGF